VKLINKIRSCLKRNKIFFETVAAVLLSGMAIIVSCVQVDIRKMQNELARLQTKLSTDPILIIEPATQLQKNGGAFNLTIENIGNNDVFDIREYITHYILHTKGTDKGCGGYF
jgi:hypothetical protein